VALAAATAAGCGRYNTTGASGATVGAVYIPFFQDQTSGERAINLSGTLTERIVGEFQRQRGVRVFQGEAERGEADKELLGVVRSLHESVLSRDPQESGEEYRVVLAVGITYTDLQTGQVLWQDPNVTGDGTYPLEAGDAGFQDALDEAVDEVVARILDRTIKAW
jgi:hypothetical protein